MKKAFVLAIAVIVVLLGLFAYTSQIVPDAPFHIGIVTGTSSQSEDDLRGAELMIQRYGDVEHGGMIQHLAYPDDFLTDLGTTVDQIAKLAEDPKMKVIIVNQAIPGTSVSFHRVKERREDILCFAGEAHESPDDITSAADLVVNSDFVARGYLIVDSAKKLGCDTFVHISFPRHLDYEIVRRRVAVMQEACRDLGLRFVFETAPDPIGPEGVAGAQQFMMDKVPEWVERYGKNAAFFCTNDALTQPLIRQIAKFGGYFVEADLPSPLMGYPDAFNIDLEAERKAEDWDEILKKVEGAVTEAGAAGRLGTWAYSYGYTNSAALVEFGKRVAEGKASLDSVDDLLACYSEYTPGATWNAHHYVDHRNGTESKNMLLVYQDTYVFGKGYLGTTKVEIPEKYLHMYPLGR